MGRVKDMALLFVQFESEESAIAAFEKLNGSSFGDKEICRYVGKFVKKIERIVPGPDARYTNLYLKNLDTDITEAVLQEKFSSFGKIVSLTIAKDNNGNGISTGFGFVYYEDPDDAKSATEAMNGSQFGSLLFLYCAQRFYM